MHAHTHTDIYPGMCLPHILAHIHIHTCTDTCTHICTHTHTHLLSVLKYHCSDSDREDRLTCMLADFVAFRGF